MSDSNRIEYIDYLNVFCCLSVIALHCNGCFWKFSYESYWISSVFIECIFYFAVPIFFMITGITLFDYKITATFAFFKSFYYLEKCRCILCILFKLTNGKNIETNSIIKESCLMKGSVWTL